MHHDPTRAPWRNSGAGVPTLAEVLSWARDPDVAVNVELKHDVPQSPRPLDQVRVAPFSRDSG